MLIGCGKKEAIPMEEQLADDEVVLENIKYKLDKDETGYGISYKIAENFRKTELINAINYFSENINDRIACHGAERTHPARHAAAVEALSYYEPLR